MSEARELIFGLSIDEKIEWAVAQATASGLPEILEQGECHLPDNPPDDFSLHFFLESQLPLIWEKLAARDIQKEKIRSFGVSSIGVVDRKNHRLQAIKRKSWGVFKDDEKSDKIGSCVVDFESLLLKGKFKKNPVDIWVRNDASAKFYAEKSLIADGDENRLLYIIFDEGVNCGFIFGSHDPDVYLHPEFGHILPIMHKDDTDFIPKHSGCAIHTVCYEGIASSERILKTWHQPLEMLGNTHPAQEIISFYIAQAVMAAILTVSPGSVLLGGAVVHGNSALLSRVKSWVIQLNNGYLPDLERLIKKGDFIRPARLGQKVRVRGALQLAKMAAFPVRPISK